MRTYVGTLVRGEYIPGRTFICMVCGEPYAKVATGNEFIPYRGMCESCTPLRGWVPGSVFDELRSSFNSSLPLAAWQREVELHCRWAETKEL